ncbi:NEDD4-binding protein 2 [Pristimantis euphronides]
MMLENFDRVTVNSILNLSPQKASKNADNSQKKTEKNGNMADMSSSAAATQKSSQASKDSAEFSPDAVESEIKNLPAAENENEMEVIQLIPTINTDNEDCALDASVDEALDQHGPDTDSESTLLSDRPELLNFIGDWPVEKSMSQRAPRSKKARARPDKHNPSVQENGDHDKTANPNTEQMDKATDQEQIDDKSSDEDLLEEAVALVIEPPIDSCTVNSDDDHLVGLENQLCTSLPTHNKKDCVEDDDKSEGTVIEKISEIQEQVAECTNGQDIQSALSFNEDVRIKPRQPRRNCRNCKLALNFTNNCAISSKQEESECIQQPSVDLCKFSQTEPHDFALAWRIERRNVDLLDSAKIIVGNSSKFRSKSLDGSSDAQENIPYRIMQHKSTFVEEEDIINLGDQDSLEILCKLFRSLSSDVLKDLFERCNKDIEWTTNLLLDSGEKIYKGEECESEEWEDLESCSQSDKDNSSEEKSITVTEEDPENVETNHSDCSLKASEYSPFVNALPLIVAEELKNGNVLSSNDLNLHHRGRLSELQEMFPNHETITDTISSDLMWSLDIDTEHPITLLSSPNILQHTNTLKTITKAITEDLHLTNTILPKKSDTHRPEILVSENNQDQEFTEVTAVVEEENKTQNKSKLRSKSNESLHFNYLELALPPEFAFQLTELFGPVGIDPGSLTIEDCVVPIDLKLAECIHKKWKESITERHRQEALSYQLIFQGNLSDDTVNLDRIPQKSESGVSQRDTDLFPFMDQWNTRRTKVSMRQIIAEEMAIQAHEDSKKSLSSKNCAVKMKEKQLLELFPNVEQQLLLDIFKENDYSLEKTEQFMSSVLEADPVQNVIAPGFKQTVPTMTETNKEKKLKSEKEVINERYFQDLEFPNYDDFRAEAFIYHQRQQESYRKAAEAHNRGMKQVAAYYAQQGYLYGQKMKEENRRAAVHIFERVNECLLPENILDLHGLHVDEAMKHFRKVLQDKREEFKQNGGKSHLLVITGRGNHSQGGVPRIKPAIIDFLTNHNYRFQEKTPGALCITLK